MFITKKKLMWRGMILSPYVLKEYHNNWCERREVTLFQPPTFFNGIPSQHKLYLIYFQN